jgi:hypothetical protein
MANLDSLNYQSITNQSKHEALERIGLLRLARRTPIKTTRMITKKTAKPKEVKALALSEQDRLELIKLLENS